MTPSVIVFLAALTLPLWLLPLLSLVLWAVETVDMMRAKRIKTAGLDKIH